MPARNDIGSWIAGRPSAPGVFTRAYVESVIADEADEDTAPAPFRLS